MTSKSPRPKTPTASTLERALHCPAAWALPHTPSRSSAASDFGTGVHTYLAEAWTLGPAAALARVPADAPWRDLCEGLSLEQIADGRRYAGVETTYVYDLERDTARRAGSGLGRRYGVLSATEIAGTADLLLWDAEERLHVVDYKTGQDLGPPEENAQLAFLALAVARYHGLSEVAVELYYTREDGSHRAARATLDALDLDAWAVWFRLALRQVRAAQADATAGRPLTVHPGDHCRYCPAFDACPAQRALARELGAGLGLPAETVAALSPEAAGKVWERLEAAEEVLKAVREQLRELAHTHPPVLSDGRRLAYVECSKEEILAEVAIRTLEQRYGPVQAASCVDRRVTKASLRRALGEPEEALAAIAAAGGIRRVPYTQLRAVGKRGGK